jgi:membrane fusion protein, multidrug efflux system
MKRIINFSLFIISISMLATACGGGNTKTPEQQLEAFRAEKTALEAKITELEKTVNAGKPVERKVKTVALTPLAVVPFKHFIDLQGRVDASESQQITSKMPGTLKRVLIKVGDNVRTGQLVAELDGETMTSQLDEMRRQLTFATDLFNRQKGLWDQKIGSEVQFLQAKNGKESMEGAISTMEENLKNLRIYSPLSGSVDMLFGKTGSAIAPGMPLANVLNLSKLKIKGEVPESYAAKVKSGDIVQVFFPDLQKEISTRVTYVSKSINPINRTFTVECALPNGAEYRANLVAVMKIVDYQSAKAVTVPINVIQQTEEGEFVFIGEKSGEKQAIVRKTLVKTGANYGGKIEILSGLKTGDQLITTGFQEVNNGESVNF